jgi:hypothetical protein
MMHNQLTKRTQGREQTVTSQHAHASVLAHNRGYVSLQSQPLMGNHTALRQLGSGRLQAKLTISQPGDMYEQEADRVAEQVMNMRDIGVKPSASSATRAGPMSCSACAPAAVQGNLASAPNVSKKREALLQRRAMPETESLSAPSIVHEVIHAPGQPLETSTRTFMESRFGHDFSSVRAAMESRLGLEPGTVRIHTGERADRAARLLNARAFTVGNDVFFGRSEYSPSTGQGQRLLAHELVHVAQQKEIASAANTLMRQVKVPSAEELTLEIGTLRLRLAELIDKEQQEGTSLAERSAIERRLAWLEKVAAAPDLTRQRIIYLRERIRELRDKMKGAPPSSAREEIAVRIQEHERELAKALETNVARIEGELAELQKTVDISPAIGKQINAAETELLENEAELKILRRIFTPQKAESVAQIYKKEVTPDMSGKCMGAIYKGLEAIYSPKVSSDIKAQVIKDSRKILKETGRDTNDVDRIIETLRQHSMAGQKVLIKYSLRHKAWKPSVESTVLGMVSPDYPGWYFFGLSVSGGYHSVILVVDNSEGTPRIYWMDQYSKGFTNEVTGKLDKEMKVDWLEPSYGFTDSTVWPLIPTEGAVVEIK